MFKLREIILNKKNNFIKKYTFFHFCFQNFSTNLYFDSSHRSKFFQNTMQHVFHYILELVVNSFSQHMHIFCSLITFMHFLLEFNLTCFNCMNSTMDKFCSNASEQNLNNEHSVNWVRKNHFNCNGTFE